MVHYNEVGFEIYHGQNYFNCHSGTTYEVRLYFEHNYCTFLLVVFFCHEDISPEAAFLLDL